MNTIYDNVKEQKEFAEKYGWTLGELQLTLFVVTEKGKPMIVRTKNGISISREKGIMKDKGIIPAIVYTGNGFHALGFGYSTNDAYADHKLNKYMSNARDGITGRECIEKIIADSNGEITFI